MLSVRSLDRGNVTARAFRSTTFRLRFVFALIVLAAVAYFFVIDQVVSQTRTSVDQIGNHAERAVAYTNRALSDLGNREVHEADYLIAPGDANVAAAEAASRDAARANDELRQAIQDIALSPDEQQLVDQAALALDEYSTRWGQLNTLHQANDTLGAVAVFRYMTDLMRGNVAAPLNQLVALNEQSLRATYAGQASSQLITSGLILVVGVVLSGFLLRLQAEISARMKRTLTVPLLLAALVVIGFTILTLVKLNQAQNALRQAATSDFVSIQTMSHLRVQAYAAKADRSRYLSDTELAQQYDQAFAKEATTLAHVGDNRPLSAATFDRVYAAAQQGRITFQGDLATGLANADTPQERQAALAALDHWGKYLKIDAQIRQLESSGRHDQAVALALGDNPGQSNYEFTQFDQAVGQVIALNQDQFDADLGEVLQATGSYQIWAAVAALLVVGLSWLGIRARLAEYR
ncbi:MAG TPA: hypothetical protein VFZ25_17615 [Chloroflexota bacterium]|nr:hypothetical protein [Chloroflexota bacterium]